MVRQGVSIRSEEYVMSVVLVLIENVAESMGGYCV